MSDPVSSWAILVKYTGPRGTPRGDIEERDMKSGAIVVAQGRVTGYNHMGKNHEPT